MSSALQSENRPIVVLFGDESLGDNLIQRLDQQFHLQTFAKFTKGSEALKRMKSVDGIIVDAKLGAEFASRPQLLPFWILKDFEAIKSCSEATLLVVGRWTVDEVEHEAEQNGLRGCQSRYLCSADIDAIEQRLNERRRRSRLQPL